MIYFYYGIVIFTVYLLFCSWSSYIMEKREKEIKDKILFTSFKYRKEKREGNKLGCFN